MNPILRTGAAIVAGLALTLVPAPATAAPSPGASALDAAKQAVTARIDKRLDTLKKLSGVVRGAKHLDASHRATLDKLIADDQTGLTALRAKVASETTAAAVREDARSMVQDYRVYLLVVPQVRLSVALDVEAAAVSRLRTTADKLATAIDKAKKAGKDTAKAEADLVDLRAKLDKVESSIKGKADALLAIEPGPDTDGLKRQVQQIRDTVRTARADLRQAATDAKSIRRSLRG